MKKTRSFKALPHLPHLPHLIPSRAREKHALARDERALGGDGRALQIHWNARSGGTGGAGGAMHCFCERFFSVPPSVLFLRGGTGGTLPRGGRGFATHPIRGLATAANPTRRFLRVWEKL